MKLCDWLSLSKVKCRVSGAGCRVSLLILFIDVVNMRIGAS